MRDGKVSGPFIAACVALAVGCGGGAGGGSQSTAGSDAKIAKPRHDGRMRLADAWLEVTPVVINDAHMDLVTLCQLIRDEAKKAGKADAELCFGPDRRVATAVTKIRVELHKGTFREALTMLADKNEGAHVFADKTGTLYQILDFALPARREGTLRTDEVRMLAIEGPGKAAIDALIAELAPVFPNAQVEVVTVATPAPAPTPAPGPAPAPTPAPTLAPNPTPAPGATP